MTEIATIDWFGRWGTSVFSENTATFCSEKQFSFIGKARSRRATLSCDCSYLVSRLILKGTISSVLIGLSLISY